MTLLAIDTAHAAVSACVLGADGAVLARETQPMVRGHSEALLPLVERVMAAAGLGFEALSRVAVVVGPGSFTGIRIGIAAAQAIALASGAKVVGVSSLAAFAAPLIGPVGDGVIAAAIDAKHGQVYAEGFSPQGRVVLSPRVAPVPEAVAALGPGPLRLVGSGATIMAIEAWSHGIEAEVINDAPCPEIEFVARLGLIADPSHAPARPYYLKAPEAKPQRAGLIARAQ